MANISSYNPYKQMYMCIYICFFFAMLHIIYRYI